MTAPTAAIHTTRGIERRNGSLQSSRIPDDFPSRVPLPERKPSGAVRSADQDGVTWMIHSSTAETEALGAEPVARGFAEESNTSVGDAMSVALYANADLRVSLGTIGGAGDRALQILVTEILER